MEKSLPLAWAVAKVVREAREAAGLTQGQLTELAGISETYISFLEHARIKASINALMQIAPAVSVEASELMRRIEEEIKRGPQAPQKKTGRPRKAGGGPGRDNRGSRENGRQRE